MGDLMHNDTALTVQGDAIAALVSDWHKHLDLQVQSGELATTTAAAYRRGWDRFSAWLVLQDAPQVDGDLLRAWIGELREKGYKTASINTWLAGVRALFAWAVGNRRLAIDPTQGVKGSSRKGTSKAHRRPALTDQEVMRVLAQPDRTATQGARDYAILALMAFTAARTVEIHRADLADLQTASGRLVLMVQGKGRQEKDEPLVITQEAEAALHDWLVIRGSSPGALFVSLSNRSQGEQLSLRALRGIVKGYYQAAGVADDPTRPKTTHSMRHAAISNAIRHGAPVQKVRSMARHASIDTTMIYYHELDRLTDPAERYISYNGKGEK